MRRLALLLAVVSACGSRHVLGHGKGTAPDHAGAIDAGAGAPDAEPVVPDAPPPAPPAEITFDHQPWQPGDVVTIRRKVALVDGNDSASAADAWDLQLKIASVSGGDVIADAGPDCIARFTNGTVKITGACGGADTDVAYKLDLVAQLLAFPRGTVHGGDRVDITRPLVALFRLQEAGAIVTAQLAAADAAGATYGVHVQLDGQMLKQGLHVIAGLDGTIHVDPHTTTMTGTLTSPRATITGWPMPEYRSRGTLTLDFAITVAH